MSYLVVNGKRFTVRRPLTVPFDKHIPRVIKDRLPPTKPTELIYMGLTEADACSIRPLVSWPRFVLKSGDEFYYVRINMDNHDKVERRVIKTLYQFLERFVERANKQADQEGVV